jgi:hypothetical protein
LKRPAILERSRCDLEGELRSRWEKNGGRALKRPATFGGRSATPEKWPNSKCPSVLQSPDMGTRPKCGCADGIRV